MPAPACATNTSFPRFTAELKAVEPKLLHPRLPPVSTCAVFSASPWRSAEGLVSASGSTVDISLCSALSLVAASPFLHAIKYHSHALGLDGRSWSNKCQRSTLSFTLPSTKEKRCINYANCPKICQCWLVQNCHFPKLPRERHRHENEHNNSSYNTKYSRVIVEHLLNNQYLHPDQLHTYDSQTEVTIYHEFSIRVASKNSPFRR